MPTFDQSLQARAIAPVNPARFTKLAGGVRAALNRTSRAAIASVPDSTGAGWGAGVAIGTGAGANAGSGGNFSRAASMPQQFAALLNAAGVPTRDDSIWGTGNPSPNTLAEFVNSQPGHVFGADWSVYASQSLGGSGFQAAAGTSSWTTRKWKYAADGFDIYYLTLNTLGTFTVSDASGTLATVDTSVVVLPPGAGAGGFGKTTVMRDTASKSPISIQRTGVGGNVIIQAIVPFDSTQPRLEIWNMGWAGSKTADWNPAAGVNGWRASYALKLIDQPVLWHLELGLNDQNTGVSAATYQANLQAIANNLKAGGGDLIIGRPHRPYLDNASWLLSAAHAQAVADVAAASGAPMVDYRAMNLLQTDYFDVPHLTSAGYAKKAQALLTELLK